MANRDLFPTEADGSHLTDGTRGPDWIDYLYELHNRGLILVNGWIMREAAAGTAFDISKMGKIYPPPKQTKESR